MKRVTDFFLLCSGVNPELLAKCPGERTKYAGLGATIFFTGVFAFFSASYALYFVFNSVLISIAFGLVWGLMIFNLDRFIVSTMRKRGNFLRELAAALPRLVVAVVISIVIAMPLELKIFEKEINPELVLMEQMVFAQEEKSVRDRFEKAETDLQKQVSELDREFAARTSKKDVLLQVAREEADGTGGSRVKNLGPIYKIKKADADKAQQELDDFKKRSEVPRQELNAKIQANDSLRKAALSALEYAHRDGPAARMEALSNLKAKSEPIRVAGIFIMLLIIAVETAPVFVKLISPKGPYDNLVSIDEFSFSTRELDQVAHISAEARRKAPDLPQNERGFLTDSLDKQLNIPPSPSQPA
jgi:hypothetical protein